MGVLRLRQDYSGEAMTTHEISLQHLMDLNAHLGGDPLATLMRERGFDPDEGGVLIIPAQLEAWSREALGRFAPNYIRFSPLVDEPLLVRDTILAGGFST